MFKLSQSSSYTWPVEVEFPVSGGKTEKQTFDAEFKRLSQSRIKEIQDAIGSGEIGSDDVLAREILIGWKGITDDHGEEVPFSESSFRALLDVPLVSTAIVTAFFKSLSGAKRKN